MTTMCVCVSGFFRGIEHGSVRTGVGSGGEGGAVPPPDFRT